MISISGCGYVSGYTDKVAFTNCEFRASSTNTEQTFHIPIFLNEIFCD